MAKKKKNTQVTEEENVNTEEVMVDESSEEEGVEQGLADERDQAPIIKKPEPPKLDGAIEKQVTAMGKDTAKKLRNSPQEKVRVPKDPLNPKDSFVVVGINGWNLQIQREVDVHLPKPVIDLLRLGGYNPTLVK